MKALAVVVVLAMAIGLEAQHDLDPLSGLSCPKAGYMFPDAENLCFVWFCERAGEAPIKRMCPKGVRVPTWWTGGEVGVCNIVNIVKHGGEPVCLRCAADDVQPDDSCAARPFPCDEGCTCVDIEHTHKCDCPVTLGVVGDGSVPAPVDHCSPCVNGGTCQNQWDGFFCFCPNGWTGHRCETSGKFCQCLHCFFIISNLSHLILSY
ncbi:hypothetical protein EB796_024775 [Bugula neritina]|uniref:EGF-like domain-containing protein n=1 Tax=Bugula neritina TaxID=10212 RepID=A0A7J7ITK8_BUGNE|nr:hypothetical protein EB796_024775 [Bugula neritina]